MQSLSELPELPQAESTGDREGIQNAIVELKAKEAEAEGTEDVSEEQETAEAPDEPDTLEEPDEKRTSL